MTHRRPTSTSTVSAVAECMACSTRYSGANALALAARHHDATGHAIATVVERRIVYGDTSPTGPTLFDNLPKE